jgi:hypothetical protein
MDQTRRLAHPHDGAKADVEVVDVGSIPAERVIEQLLDGEHLRRLAGHHGVACFALPGALHARAFYNALIERSADIDAATRRHVAFIVFYGDRSGLVRRVDGYRPHLARYRLEGLSTSTDASFEAAEFSDRLGDLFRYRPEELSRSHFHHSMADCTRVLLDRYAIRHVAEPCLLFVDPTEPNRHTIVPLAPRDPARSLMQDVLAPMSEAFRELSAYWKQRDELRWHDRDLREARDVVGSAPEKLERFASQIRETEGDVSIKNRVTEARVASLRELLAAFEGSLEDADLRLAALPGNASLQEALGALQSLREKSSEASTRLAGLPDDQAPGPGHERLKLKKRIQRLTQKRLSRLGQLRKRLKDEVDALLRAQQQARRPIESLEQERAQEQTRLERAEHQLRDHDAAKDAARRQAIAGSEANLRGNGYPDEILAADDARAFAVVEKLHQLGRLGPNPTKEAASTRHGASHPGQQWERPVAVITGIAFLALLVVVAALLPKPTEFQEFVFRVVLAVAAAAFGSTIPGLLEVDLRFAAKLAIRAAGALGLFVTVFLVNPPKLVASASPVQNVPVSSAVGRHRTGESCTSSDLALTMEVPGVSIPGQRGGGGGRFSSGRLYQFTLANISTHCTSIVRDIRLAVLARVEDEHLSQEATTAENHYEVIVSPEDVGKDLDLIPLAGAPKVRWGYHFAPGSAPDRFAVEVVPSRWGYAYAIQFLVHWYEPGSDKIITTASDVYAAFFPDRKGGTELVIGADGSQFREAQRAAWSKAFGKRVR